MVGVNSELLVVDGLSYRYPGSGRGIDGCSLEAHAGEVTVIRGASGSGKSTLLACIGGILTPDRGTVRSVDRGGSPSPVHATIVTQGAALFEQLTVWQNVATAWGWPRPARRARAIRALERFDVGRLADALPRELSFGQRQRVAIAGAVAGDAGVLLADEPTGSLDAVNAARVTAALRAAARGASGEPRIVVVVTHDDRLAREANRVVELRASAAPASEVTA